MVITPHLRFALALHDKLPTTGDLVWSPYSVAAALGLAAAGARGRTHDELAAALAPSGRLSEFGDMLSAAATLEDAEVAVANSLWMRQGLPFRDEYQQTVLGWPGGALHVADFHADPEGSRQKINDDVEQTTRGLIQELLAPGGIDPDTAAVIVNALYLKSAWRTPFPAGATEPATFHAPSGTREVPTMRQLERLRYAAVDGWRMVTLPAEGDLAVDVLLPGAADLTPELLNRLQDDAGPTRVEVALPRFRVEAAATLNRPLGALGIELAFTKDADFSGITPEKIWIDAVEHKAVLNVDEQGFEGAAATAIAMRLASLDLSKPVPFHVDRPFLVLVRHARTGAVYFVARVTEP